MSNTKDILSLSPIVPVIVINRVEDAVPLANAMVDAGFKTLEITLRTPEALGAISRIKENVENVVVGAGTVLNVRDVANAVSAGAEFLVSPGCTTSLLSAALSTRLPFLPGVSTASEVMTVLERGLNCMKLFPAEASGGTALLKALQGPFPQVSFCPTGGVSPANLDAYLALNNVICVGGSWMIDKSAMERGDWDEVGRQAQFAMEACRKTNY
ncbi:bifunctional 4-hydroxy-2-oxoglutarate aldolase/2-dehydro-3-deoxy-phosphogluconate aldolase [Pseudoteredinibacter isoporae]|uniref:2-dehydro-3-deoxyphosphogluconate aldolase/(4S)-4-hydroxy-2-oxoglutarate aldolase n=1 Tax=Pseudoteredinibacter isoporae TaxID=570281 RepID=A0A7X0MWL9_9GAMM|nr:2-dehydro-3-deoxyphosphogluconate aldolase/(4S)-4-hydroxy-2-oxoglutarate aldolase [Pseudoteredinibacter isoporae]NHO88148.1 bifunctional 4-hydroxy-2-oxoglutarate aldolase/2-dehydro-3-deoxy-phosphogluconate aldolase [Pseudoteredinibacter isoporae]NIB23521.1 bifunctional 4-hydroxy-2-oxoglutarate aldolase/2-dehydro-3-deoxy-phosphogluconate aldolase [Pseudoteredinibacter isoporae]